MKRSGIPGFRTPAGGMGMMERKDGVWNEKAVTLTVENEKSADLP